MHHKIYQKKQLESLTSDSAVFEQIQEKVANGEIALPESVMRDHGDLESTISPMSGALESMAGGNIEAGEFNVLEAIILREGRPPLFIKNDEYEEPRILELKERLNPHRDKINKAIKSVGRLEILNHPSYTYVGTAWMIDEDVMITNRHVVNTFAFRRGRTITVRTDSAGNMFNTQVDFREEHEQKLKPFEVAIEEVLYLEREGSNRPDMALVRVAKSRRLPDPIEISPIMPFPGQDICVIGYPAKDGFRNDASLMRDLFGDIYQVKRLSPGKVAAQMDGRIVFSHDCTTLGGNSGSVVLDNVTGKAFGLHFSGSFMEENLAVKGKTILNTLADVNTNSIHILPNIQPPGKEEAPPKAEEMEDRIGYDPEFLHETIDMPNGLVDGEDDFATLRDSNDTELKYQHYSVKMHKKRKMAAYTASNIDGNKWFQIPRARDKWYFDPRMEKEKQIGNDFYKGNNMHRGHLVRRLDPAWGDSRDVALRGVEDTFFWTNCTPQHRNFNPKSWLGLEDYILRNAVNEDLKLSVFTGPVFRYRDKKYRGHQIPEDYWKVLIFNHAERNTVSATAYLLSQSEFMDDVEFVYGAYKTYQVPVQKITDLTHIDFEALKEFDPLDKNEAVPFLEVTDNAEMIL